MLKVIKEKQKHTDKSKKKNSYVFKEFPLLKHNQKITFLKPLTNLQFNSRFPKLEFSQKQNRKSTTKLNRSKEIVSTTHYSNNQFSLSKYKERQVSSAQKRLTSLKQIQTQTPNFYQTQTNQLNQFKIQQKKHFKSFIGTKLKKKIKQYFLFLDIINISNRHFYKTPQNRRYKVFIGKGNNSKLVKKAFQNRFWWTIASSIDQQGINLVWTQWSKSVIFSLIPQQENLNDEIKLSENRKIPKRYLQYKKKYQLESFQSLLSNHDQKQFQTSKLLKNNQNEFKSRNFAKSMTFIKPVRKKQILITHNHIENHDDLTNKKCLFNNLKRYCQQNQIDLFTIVPLTFHIKGQQNQFEDIKKYQQLMNEKKQKILWIVKPGQNSNRGSGIQLFKKIQAAQIWIQKQRQKRSQRTFIIQKYLFPFLYHRRKFDIRCFVLLTANPKISAYFYRDGYLRTSSKQFSTKTFNDKFIHLTNDAIQKKCPTYGKYEKANKLSYEDFQKYLDLFEADKKLDFFNDIIPQIKELILISIKSALRLNQNNKRHTFQILGYDFMIDSNFKPWLIQINTNPCLQTPCQLQKQIITSMVSNALKIAVDPVFKPPKLQSWPQQNLFTYPEKLMQENNFELIYSSIQHYQ